MPIRPTMCVLAAILAWAAPFAPALGDDAQERPAAFVRYPEAPVSTLHTATIGGTTVDYVASAGTIAMVHDEDAQDPAASMFFIGYRAYTGLRDDRDLSAMRAAHLSDQENADLTRGLGEDAEPDPRATIERLLAAGVAPEELLTFPDPADRPVTFSFNGGPGSSSVWLHLGLFGPERVDHADDFGHPGAPPHRLVPNEFSLLDASDFVFIDPVSTGFSRAEGETSAKDFHGVRADVRSVGEFIRRWLGDAGRWASPKFLAGESYGTTRAAGLSRELQNRHGIALNGIVLVSAVLDFQTIRFNIGNDMPPLLYLPSFAATAHFHGQLDPDLQARPVRDLLEEVETFVQTEYLVALMRGTDMGEAQRGRIAQRVARYTGLTPEYVMDTNLRLEMPRFPKQLRRDEGITVGRLDARFTAADRDDAGESYEFDPSYAAIQSIYTETFNDYVRRELKYDSDLSYEILTSVWPWSYAGVGDNRYTNVAENLRETMQRVPSMRVFIASGYYDLATPYFATDYTVDHLMLRPDLRTNVETHYYEAGHMMYVHRPSLERLSRDLHGFYGRTLGE